MNKKLILAACMIVFACSCQPRRSDSRGNSQYYNDQDRRDDRRRPPRNGGCCETEKPESPQAPQQNQTSVSTPEVKTEKAR